MFLDVPWTFDPIELVETQEEQTVEFETGLIESVWQCGAVQAIDG